MQDRHTSLKATAAWGFKKPVIPKEQLIKKVNSQFTDLASACLAYAIKSKLVVDL